MFRRQRINTLVLHPATNPLLFLLHVVSAYNRLADEYVPVDEYLSLCDGSSKQETFIECYAE